MAFSLGVRSKLSCARGNGWRNVTRSREYCLEKMPFQPDAAAEWRRGLPDLNGSFATVREAQVGIASALWSALCPTEVVHLFAPAPTTQDGFTSWLAQLLACREAGSGFGFVVEANIPVGVIAVRALEPGFQTAEWAFAFAPHAWTTHAVAEALTLVRDFVFETVGAHRIECRTFADSDLRIACLRQVGAAEEGRLRRSSRIDDQYVDQLLWSIVKADRLN